jgi:hypothetical protein
MTFLLMEWKISMLFFVVDVISMKQKVMMDQINQVSYGLDIDSSR